MSDLVSIIVPVFNAKDTLKRCVDSLVGQTYQDIEIILIDDGSEDNCLSICRGYAEQDSRIRVFHFNNHGVSFARNQGLEYARGNYITFVDSDDYVNDELIEVLLKKTTDNNADLCVSALNENNDTEDFCISISKDYIKQILFLCRNHLIFGPTQKLYRADLISDIRFPESHQYGEDLLFNLKYLNKIEKICYVNRQMYYYCRRLDSLSTRVRWNMFENDMELHQALLEWFESKEMLTPEAGKYISDRIFDTVVNSVCLMFRQDCKLTVGETKEYYRGIAANKLANWSFDKADTGKYSKWQVFLIKHKLVNLLTAAAMIERRR